MPEQTTVLAKRLSHTGGASAASRRIFLWSVLLALIFGGLEAGKPLEVYLQSFRNL
jgi:hypothetical protein